MYGKIKIAPLFTTLFLLLLPISVLAGITTYQYDDLHRLTQVARADGTVTTYNYDDLGNRTSLSTVNEMTTALDNPIHGVYNGQPIEYEINLKAGQGITVSLDAHMSTGYLDFGLRDEHGVEIAASNDGQLYDGEQGVFDRVVHANGVYTVRITGSSGAQGNYDLIIYNAWFNPGVVDNDHTYHSTFNTAHYIHNGNYDATGTLPHYYRFTIQPNTQVDVSIHANLTQGGLDFGLLDQNGVELTGSNDVSISNGQTGIASRLIIDGGLYYIRVTQYSTAVGNYDLTITGADPEQDTDGDGLMDAQEYHYKTALNQSDTDGDGISDLNEVTMGGDPCVATHITATTAGIALTQGTAYPLPFFDQTFNVEHPGSTTWYALDLSPGQGITIVLSAYLDYGGLDFSFRDASGVELAGSNDVSISNGQTGIASRTVTAGGTYYIRVTQYSTAVGNYDLTVYNAWFNPEVTDNDRTYNSTSNTSHYIQNGNYDATGTLPHYYRFTIKDNTQVDVNLTAHLDRGGLDFGLLDQNGVELTGSNDVSISNGQTGIASRLIIDGGLYYIRVTQYSTAVGNYDLTITGANPDQDTDGDGLTDAQEYHYGTNILNFDSDNDGMPDGWEVINNLLPTVNDADDDKDNDDLTNLLEYTNITNPQVADTDADGIPDGWEVQYGLNPTVSNTGNDTDHDGYSDHQEYLNNTDPMQKNLPGGPGYQAPAGNSLPAILMLLLNNA